MPKKAAGLSARKVETIKTPGLFADGGGLYLQVTKARTKDAAAEEGDDVAIGSKSWIFRYVSPTLTRPAKEGSEDGKPVPVRRDMGLGPLADVSLAKARELAAAARQQVAVGIDPIEAKKAAAAAQAVEAARLTTFKQCAEAFIGSMRAGWKNAKHAAQWGATLEAYAYPTLGALPVDAIDTGLVLKVLEPLWTAKTETASRLRGRLEAILDYAKVRELRSGENPARWKGHLDHILPARGDVKKTRHHASLPYGAVADFWPRLQLQDGMGARALEVCILTATRSGEVLAARWEEFDLVAAVWTIPPQRMKAGNEHRVPLSKPALALLRKLDKVRRGEFVFPAHGNDERHLSNMSMAMVLRRMEVDATVHGFRSTFRTWAAERTRHAHEVAEAALAHVVGDKVVAAYQRGDLFEKRRRLMEDWAKYLEAGAAGGKVVHLRA